MSGNCSICFRFIYYEDVQIFINLAKMLLLAEKISKALTECVLTESMLDRGQSIINVVSSLSTFIKGMVGLIYLNDNYCGKGGASQCNGGGAIQVLRNAEWRGCQSTWIP